MYHSKTDSIGLGKSKSLLALLVSTALVWGLLLPATASSQMRRAVTVEFSELVAQHHGDNLVIGYEIDDRDWRKLRRNNASLELHLRGPSSDPHDQPFHHVLSVETRRHRTVVAAHGKLRDARYIEVELTSADDWVSVQYARLQDRLGATLDIPILVPDKRPHPFLKRFLDRRRLADEPPAVDHQRPRSRDTGVWSPRERLEQRRQRQRQRLEERRQRQRERFEPDTHRPAERLEERRQRHHERLDDKRQRQQQRFDPDRRAPEQ